MYNATLFPSLKSVSVISRKASSIDKGSITGVISLKISKILLEISLYLPYLTGKNIPIGHLLLAINPGIAECTPYFLAS